jgi:hypothetical protein
MPITADRKDRVYEGVKIHCGALFAVNANTDFQNKYYAKHGTCLDAVLRNSSDFDAQNKYVRREADVYERYMMWRVHMYDKQHAPKPQVFTYEGGMRE